MTQTTTGHPYPAHSQPGIARSHGVFAAGCILILLFLCSQSNASEQEESLPFESERIAALILRFASYATWSETHEPPEDSQSLVFWVPVRMESVQAFKTIEGRTIRDRKAIVRYYHDRIEGSAHVVLFHPEICPDSLKLLEALRGTSVLTVGFNNEFCSQGGILRLFDKGGRPAFAASLANLDSAGLRLSARMLSLADQVHRASD